jgi:hypothetical protein
MNEVQRVFACVAVSVDRISGSLKYETEYKSISVESEQSRVGRLELRQL